jgi:hypothetical protein
MSPATDHGWRDRFLVGVQRFTRCWAIHFRSTAVGNLDPWSVIDVTDWLKVSQESRGRRPKWWVENPADGTLWLRKEHRESRPFEPAIEVLALRLARASGLPAPRSFPCVWVDGQARKRGVVIETFAPPPKTLSVGSEILGGHDPDYDRRDHGMHTLDRVMKALRHRETLSGTNLVEPFTEVLVFDAWVGNGDRHQENWGIIRLPNGSESLTPIFDPAACLGAELQSGHDLLPGIGRGGQSYKVRLDGYIGRCTSGFGPGRKLLRHDALVVLLKSSKEWRRALARWVPAFRLLLRSELRCFLRTIPEDWLPQERRVLAWRLLCRRLRRMDS